MDKSIRLDKFLSNAGVLSRRGIKQLLKKEEITVNGKRVKESGIRIFPEKDEVKLNGELIKPSEKVYFLLNKPKGYISTTSDELDRENVVSLIDTTERIYPVGRLDKDTHGLMLLTNDGELTHRLIHPKFHIPKTYKLIIEGKVSPQKIKALETGVILSDGITLPAEIKILKENDKETVLTLTIHEGRNRQIRRMCETLGLELTDLQRIAFGPFKLEKLELGESRKLTDKEILLLKEFQP